MALFESLAFLCAHDMVLGDMQKSQALVRHLMKEQDFIDCIRRQPVDSSVKVNIRFNNMNEIIQRL